MAVAMMLYYKHWAYASVRLCSVYTSRRSITRCVSEIGATHYSQRQSADVMLLANAMHDIWTGVDVVIGNNIAGN